MRALLIESDLSAAHAIGRMLRSDGFVTDHTCSAPAALELTRRHVYDVILLDLTLEGGRGSDLLRRVRTCCTAPVLALSGPAFTRASPTGGAPTASSPTGTTSTGTTEARAEALACGAADVMARPFERRELTAHLNAIIWAAPAQRLRRA